MVYLSDLFWDIFQESSSGSYDKMELGLGGQTSLHVGLTFDSAVRYIQHTPKRILIFVIFYKFVTPSGAGRSKNG
jgi:hypothetical protein